MKRVNPEDLSLLIREEKMLVYEYTVLNIYNYLYRNIDINVVML